MSFVLLPCEVYDREFDAKLLLACRLVGQYNHQVLIGYDKHFHNLIRRLPACTLLEKSCSKIMWEYRIKPTKIKGGKIIVNDEEGFVNINEETKATFVNRVNIDAAKEIEIMACWGKRDYNFYSNIKELKPKLKELGNCRSDLLGEIGEKFYSELSTSLKNIYGNFILCSDNFAIERSWY